MVFEEWKVLARRAFGMPEEQLSDVASELVSLIINKTEQVRGSSMNSDDRVKLATLIGVTVGIHAVGGSWHKLIEFADKIHREAQ